MFINEEYEIFSEEVASGYHHAGYEYDGNDSDIEEVSFTEDRSYPISEDVFNTLVEFSE